MYKKSAKIIMIVKGREETYFVQEYGKWNVVVKGLEWAR